MLSIMHSAYHRLRYLCNQRGIETLEWILIAAVISAMALAVYPGPLRTALSTAITNISSALTGSAPAPPAPPPAGGG